MLAESDLSISTVPAPIITALRQLATGRPTTNLTAALAAYENARCDGLCHDGAWECALAVLSAERPQ